MKRNLECFGWYHGGLTSRDLKGLDGLGTLPRKEFPDPDSVPRRRRRPGDGSSVLSRNLDLDGFKFRVETLKFDSSCLGQ